MAQRSFSNHYTRTSKHLNRIMNAKQTIPALAKVAPVIATAGPPALIGVGVGLVLLWLLSDDKKEETSQALEPTPEVLPPIADVVIPSAPATASTPSARVAKRIRREDIAEALEYGSRSVPRIEAVVKLQTLGFHKTAAYKALSPSGRFAEFIEIAPDGLIEWKG